MEILGAAPARLGRYELLARLASGGMGEIFLARLEGAAGFEKLVVIKRILPHLADDERFRAMLIAEAQIASMMTHPNVCQVYELGETLGQLYIVMEYLEGITLFPLLRKVSKEAGMLELGFIGGVLQQVTEGLHYAHELKDRGGEYLCIVHRDITPSNLFLTDSGVVKVLDFGIAKVKNASAHTQTGTVKGKHAYMSPEQLRGAAVDRRSDVFALGIVVYEMLALRRLFQRKTDYLTFRAVMEQPIIDIRTFRPDCPGPLAAALSRALDRDPANRFETARQFGRAVLDAIAAVTQPWAPGEISDFVSSNFARDLQDRSEQIASAVRTGATEDAVPQIVRFDAGMLETDDVTGELDLPPVDSAMAELPAGDQHVRGQHVRGVSAPYIAIGEQHGSAPRLGASHDGRETVPAPSPMVSVNGRRGLFWPLVAFALVAITGGALFLVWRQMQNQPPTSVVITRDSDSRVTERGSNVIVVGPNPVAPGRAVPPTDVKREAPGRGSAVRKRPPVDPYHEVVRKKQVDANRCATEHGNPLPGTRVIIVVAPDGQPRSVTIDPARAGATPLGVCIKKVFKTATFPRGDKDHDLEVKLVPPA
jgi:serine/threonine-protein kinase